MGTDIHFYVERREANAWVTCDKWETDEDGYFNVPYDKRLYTDRNYDLFAMLADVCNGYGFAGCPTGHGFVPLAKPRGVPDDCCPEYRKHFEAHGDHSASYCTVAELIAYDWTQETTKSGILDLAEYLRWRPYYTAYKEFPRGWSGMISGPGIVIREAAEIDASLNGLKPGDVSNGKVAEEVARRLGVAYEEVVVSSTMWRNRVHVNASWGASYARCAGDFLSETMPRLWRFGPPDTVRCLFYFDS